MTLFETAREEAIEKAIASIKKTYKGTAIKVELEAQLNRRSGNVRYCTDVYPDADCDGGEVEGEDGCWVTHDLCEGTGRIGKNYGDEQVCKRTIESLVSKEAKKALIFGKFYNDGSVDSEYTFTVPLDKPHVVIEYINAFKELAKLINPDEENPLETDGAGMHIAILNSKDGIYPEGNKLIVNRARNFAKSMEPLLPALYFLSSADHQSRGLRFRQPRISLDEKYSAIAGHMGVLEYRCFETCYQRPEAFLDFFCVIANSLKYYSIKQVKEDFYGTVGKIGMKDGRGVQRFFYTQKHLEALEKGVELLKPDYKTFKELKKERNFKVTNISLRRNEISLESQWKNEYLEVVERTKYAHRYLKDNLEREYESHYRYYGSDSERADFREFSHGLSKSQWVEHELAKRLPKDVDEYVETKKKDFLFADSAFSISV